MSPGLLWPPERYVSEACARLVQGGYTRTASGSLVACTDVVDPAAPPPLPTAVVFKRYGHLDAEWVWDHLVDCATLAAELLGDGPRLVFAVAVVVDPTDEAVERVQWHLAPRTGDLARVTPVLVDARVAELHFPMLWMYKAHFTMIRDFLTPREG